MMEASRQTTEERTMDGNRTLDPVVGATGVRKVGGSCHCGKVRFEAEVNLSKGASRCNCSICARTAALGVIVKPEAFSLVGGKEHLGEYQWGSKVGTRFFCKYCGIHCFGRASLAELGGEFVSVNLNCVDDVELKDLDVRYWDGRHNNWDAGTRTTPWPVQSASWG
jgi:hypothetical protein